MAGISGFLFGQGWIQEPGPYFLYRLPSDIILFPSIAWPNAVAASPGKPGSCTVPWIEATS